MVGFLINIIKQFGYCNGQPNQFANYIWAREELKKSKK